MEPLKAVAEAERVQSIATTKQKTEIHKKNLQDDITALDKKLERGSQEEKLGWELQISQKKHELERLKVWNESELNAVKRTERSRDAIIEGVVTSVNNISNEIRSPEALVNAGEKLAQVFQQPGMTSVDNGKLLRPQPEVGLLGTNTPTGRFGLSLALQEMMEKLGTDRDKGMTMKRLLSDILHLLAELSLGEKCDPEIVASCKSKIRENVNSNEDLDSDQLDYLHRILEDDEALKQRIA